MANKKEVVKEEEVAPTNENVSAPVEPEVVPMAEYKKLYEQAVALEARFQKLAAAYNILLENYISGK